MTGRPLTRLLALAACLVATAVTACGADEESTGDPIPRAAVTELDRQLTSIENRFEFGDGACADIQNDNVPSVRAIIAGLPDGVDEETRKALRQSFDRLFDLSRSECDEARRPQTETTETSAPPPPTTQTVTTQTVTTETVTTQTTPPPTTNTPTGPARTSGQASGGVTSPTGGAEEDEG